MPRAVSRTTSFRLVLGGVAAIMAGPAIAQTCVQPTERMHFDVRALQSQLMVTALACGRENDYNAFVRKFQRELGASYNGIQGHFRRTAGGAAQRELDGYITTLANAQSQDGIRAGSHYCPLYTPLFQVALAQTTVQGLSEVTQERNVLNPLATPTCSASAPAGRSAAPPARTASSQRR